MSTTYTLTYIMNPAQTYMPPHIKAHIHATHTHTCTHTHMHTHTCTHTHMYTHTHTHPHIQAVDFFKCALILVQSKLSILIAVDKHEPSLTLSVTLNKS